MNMAKLIEKNTSAIATIAATTPKSSQISANPAIETYYRKLLFAAAARCFTSAAAAAARRAVNLAADTALFTSYDIYRFFTL